MVDAQLASATDTAAAIARGHASSHELTAALLERIAVLNPTGERALGAARRRSAP